MAYDTQYCLQYALDAEVHNVNAATQPQSQANATSPPFHSPQQAPHSNRPSFI